MRSDDALLLDMLIAARKIQQFTVNMTRDEFYLNEMAQSAVTREFQVIGEAARLISDETKTQYAKMQWNIIAGMRNRLVHEYFNVDLEIVWETILVNIPDLIRQLEVILSPPDETPN
jgi:uncharacterized protein with HEPN domain